VKDVEARTCLKCERRPGVAIYRVFKTTLEYRKHLKRHEAPGFEAARKAAQKAAQKRVSPERKAALSGRINSLSVRLAEARKEIALLKAAGLPTPRSLVSAGWDGS